MTLLYLIVHFAPSCIFCTSAAGPSSAAEDTFGVSHGVLEDTWSLPSNEVPFPHDTQKAGGIEVLTSVAPDDELSQSNSDGYEADNLPLAEQITKVAFVALLMCGTVGIVGYMRFGNEGGWGQQQQRQPWVQRQQQGRGWDNHGYQAGYGQQQQWGGQQNQAWNQQQQAIDNTVDSIDAALASIARVQASIAPASAQSHTLGPLPVHNGTARSGEAPLLARSSAKAQLRAVQRERQRLGI